MIHIALIHPQPIYRKGLTLLLGSMVENIIVVASTNNLRDLINSYRNETVDVIVWDIPSHHALNPGARLLQECFPLAKLLVLVNSKNAVYAGLLETLGANAVLTADCEISDLLQIIGELHQRYAPPPSSNHVQEPSELIASPELDETEKQMLELLYQQLSEAEIATRLRITKAQVNTKCRSLKRKLGVRDHTALLAKGIELHLIKPTNNQSKP